MFSLGADPELFLMDRKTKRYVSAHNVVPGTKEKPEPIPGDDRGGMIQADGTALEFNIQPSLHAREFVQNIDSALAAIRRFVPETLQLVAHPAVNYDLGYWEKDIPQHAKELGCDPDYNAYSGKANPRPTPPASMQTLRTGSGHIHIGWRGGEEINPFDPTHFDDCRHVSMILDRLLEPTIWDKDTTRAQMYGQLGAFRPKKYGVEYRVLSNAWLQYPSVYSYIFNQVIFAMTCLTEGRDPLTFNDGVYSSQGGYINRMRFNMHNLNNTSTYMR